MRKSYDKKSGAIIFHHTKDELRQAEAIRNAEQNKKTLSAMCKILNISQEDLEAAMKGVEASEVKEG